MNIRRNEVFEHEVEYEVENVENVAISSIQEEIYPFKKRGEERGKRGCVANAYNRLAR